MSDTGGNFKVVGFIDIDIYNKKDNVHRRYSKHNTLTKGGSQMFFARSAGSILKIAGDSFGQTYCIDSWHGRYVQANYANYINNIHNALLNIDSQVASNMDSASTFADIYNDNFDSLDKVIGYAGINLNPDVNGLEGTVDYSKGEYVVDPYTRAMRWYYKQGVASGTFNCIAMMGRPLLTNSIPQDNGCLFGKIIDKVNRCYANYVRNSTAFCPPGVTGITDNDTILLNFTQDNISRWKYSISTGEVTQVPDTDVFWCPIQNALNNIKWATDYFVDGDYLYVLSMYNKNTINSGYYVSVFQISTQSNITSYSFGGTYTYINNCHFIKYNDSIYVTWNTSYNNVNNSTISGRGSKLNSNGTYYSSMTTVNDMISELGITLPSGIDSKLISFGNYGSTYLVSIGDSLIEVSDLSNIHSSMLSIIPLTYMGADRHMVPFNAGSNKGWLGLGCPGGGTNVLNNIVTEYDTDGYWYTKMNSPTTEYNSNFNNSGVFLCMDGWWTSLLSFAILSEPITKGDDDEMYVSYGYKVVV